MKNMVIAMLLFLNACAFSWLTHGLKKRYITLRTLLKIWLNINKPQKKVNNRYFQEWKDKNYYEVHYIRVKHKKLNDENNVFLE
jgi:hypothetical protein